MNDEDIASALKVFTNNIMNYSNNKIESLVYDTMTAKTSRRIPPPAPEYITAQSVTLSELRDIALSHGYILQKNRE